MDMGRILGSLVGQVLTNDAQENDENRLAGLIGNMDGRGLGSRSDLLTLVLSAVTGAGGLDRLLGQLRAAGMEGAAESWIGSGLNIPADGERLKEVLGSSFLSEAASKLGVDTGRAGAALAQLIPELVNSLTPEGSLSGQEDELIGRVLSLIRGNSLEDSALN